MRLSLLPLITGLSGRLGKLVFCIEKKSGACWTRLYVKPEITEHNHEIGSAAKNLSTIYHQVNEGYMDDLKDYVDRFNLEYLEHKGYMKTFPCFMKMMYAMKRKHPSVNLKTLTIDQIMSEDLPVRSIREAVEHELLPVVKRYQELNVSIV